MNRMRLDVNFLVVGLFLLLTGWSTLTALDPGKTVTQYNVKVYDMEDGLPGNSIFAILQTQDGYLWVGTQNGLVRFDGLDFELFTRENTQLKDDNVRALYEDKKGTLWIGTNDGGLTRCKDGEFFTYPVETFPGLFKIRAINEDPLGNLWIGSYEKGLTCLSNDVFTNYTTKNGLPSDEVRTIYKHKGGGGNLWVTTSGGIIEVTGPGNFKDVPHKAMLSPIMTSLYNESTSELWIGAGKELSRFKNGTSTHYGAAEGLPPHMISTLFEDRAGNLWIGTDGGGLTRMSNGVLSTLPGGEGLTCGLVYSIYEDREGSLWVGTLGGGLHQLRDVRFTSYTTLEGLVNDDKNNTTCIHESRNGDIRVGTKGGLSRLKNGVLTTELTTGTGLLNDYVLCLLEDPSDGLWVGTWGGLQRFKDGEPVNLTKKDGLSDNRIRCILRDRQGNTWIGTQNGLNLLDGNNGEITVFTTKNGLSHNSIVFLFEGGGGDLWIGTDNGLNRLRDGVIAAGTPVPGFGGNLFQCAYEDKEGVSWFGTDSGLVRYKGGETTPYTVQCGLFENNINAILEDDRGYLWLAGHNGISRVRKKELEDFRGGKIDRVQPDWYNEKDGMRTRWCTGPGYKSRDGSFWFPTIAGVAVIDPNNIKEDTISPITIIKEVTVNGKAIDTHTKTGETNPLELAPGKKWLGFYYRGVSFINPQMIEFKVKLTLTGRDGKWNDMGTARSTTYTGLSPGHYTFKVISRNSDGVWDEEGASFSFYLKPYFTQTPEFYISAVLFVLMAAFFLYRFRVRQLRAREKELSSLVESRTRDLIQRNIELGKAHQNLRRSKEIIEEKNRHIMDSMRYASKIQEAMLPIQERMENELEEHFVIYRPKDIVSGDFYWFDVIGDYYFLAVADCTGHGVPGALLSMIGYMMLNEAVKGLDMYDPSMILDYLHQGFRSVLKQESEERHTNDGMDIGLARIEINTGTIMFAGADRPLFLVRGSELVEIKGDRKAIGGRQREEKRLFTNREFVHPGKSRERVMLYLTSDGFVDQHNPGDQKYGSRRLKEFLRDNAYLSAFRQKEELLKELKAHQADVEQRDDITIIGIRVP